MREVMREGMLIIRELGHRDSLFLPPLPLDTLQMTVTPSQCFLVCELEAASGGVVVSRGL